MNLHLYIPSLFWSESTTPAIYDDLHLPSLEALLAKSTISHTNAIDMNAWLCRTFNIKKQLDWPVAPIMSLCDNPDSEKQVEHYWLRADPVHLRIEQNHIMLADNHIFELTQDEAQQYTLAINQYINDDSLTLMPFHPHRWYIRLTNKPEIQTSTLNSAICQNINSRLPTGRDSVKWHNLFNEIQMLLHNHPLNQIREANNQITINSIWFWGGGNLPQPADSPYSTLWSNEPFSNAIAQFNHTPRNKLPSNTSHWLQENNSGEQFVILDSLLTADTYNDAYLWRENLKALEKTWFLPIYTALKNKQINQLKISTTNKNSNQDFVITHKSLWKFWITIKPLSYYAVN